MKPTGSGSAALAIHVLVPMRWRRLRPEDSETKSRPQSCRVGYRCGLASRPRKHIGFQDYFVRRRCEVRYRSSFRRRKLREPVVRALDAARTVIFCPSNPFVSIDPILAVGGIRARIEKSLAPRIAVSRIIGGKAVKGPAAKMMAELGYAVSSLSVARRYLGLIDGS